MSHAPQTPRCRHRSDVCLFVCLQVVKLLLQHGSDATDRNQGGVAAAEMTKEPRIKELLQGSTLLQQHHCEAQYNTNTVFQSFHIFSEDVSFLNYNVHKRVCSQY